MCIRYEGFHYCVELLALDGSVNVLVMVSQSYITVIGFHTSYAYLGVLHIKLYKYKSEIDISSVCKQKHRQNYCILYCKTYWEY